MGGQKARMTEERGNSGGVKRGEAVLCRMEIPAAHSLSVVDGLFRPYFSCLNTFTMNTLS